MKKLFSLIAAVLFAGSMMAAEELKATLDFSSNEAWKFPADAKAIAAASFSDGTYTITLEGTSGNGYRWYSNGSYLLLGKQGATMTLPAFEWKTTKILVYGTSGASESVKQNIFVGENAVSTETAGAKNVTNEYVIDEAYQEAGNVYVIKVTSSHNTQFSKIEIYGEGEGGGESGEGIEYDEDADLTYAFNSYTVDDEYLLDDGDVIIEAFDEQAGYKVVLDLYVPLSASGLVAGTYPINDSYEASSVAAGLFDEGMIFPSYAGIVDGEGLLEKVWYLVSGTVTVSEELNIGVVAKNSLGHDITITIANGGEGTGVKNVAADEIKAVKALENGQLVIIKNGVKYNAVGTVVR